MKKIYLSFFLIALSINLLAQNGKAFPELKGETLEDKVVNLPSDCKGKFTLIGIACSRAAEDDMQKWLNPIYNKFILKTGLMDGDYDVKTYFVPIYSGLSQVTASIGKKNMKENTDKTYFPYVVFYKGGFKKYMDELGLKDKEIPYIFLLNKDGIIVYFTEGKFTEGKLSGIEDKLN